MKTEKKWVVMVVQKFITVNVFGLEQKVKYPHCRVFDKKEDADKNADEYKRDDIIVQEVITTEVKDGK